MDDQSRNKNSFENNPKITTTAEMGQPSRVNANEDQTKKSGGKERLNVGVFEINCFQLSFQRYCFLF